MTYVKEERPDGNVLVLKNDHLEVWLWQTGASILKLLVKDAHGQVQDVVLGYAALEDYPKYRDYMGACVGRVANRIAKGCFTLADAAYQLPINNGPNCNHGGIDGFAFRKFDYTLKEDAIVFTLRSPDGEEGFPGNMDVKITYTLKDASLSIHYEAQSDADTLASFTNHAYFNLDGKASYVGEQFLQMAADAYAPVDADGLVTGQIVPAAGTPFDFTEAKPIAQALESRDDQIVIAKGLDHPFVFSQDHDQIVLWSKKTGIEMAVDTTLPQAQVYTANWFGGHLGKDGLPMMAQSAICFETQHMPNDINLHGQDSATILRKGEKLDETTVFSFKNRTC